MSVLSYVLMIQVKLVEGLGKSQYFHLESQVTSVDVLQTTPISLGWA